MLHVHRWALIAHSNHVCSFINKSADWADDELHQSEQRTSVTFQQELNRFERLIWKKECNKQVDAKLKDVFFLCLIKGSFHPLKGTNTAAQQCPSRFMRCLDVDKQMNKHVYQMVLLFNMQAY